MLGSFFLTANKKSLHIRNLRLNGVVVEAEQRVSPAEQSEALNQPSRRMCTGTQSKLLQYIGEGFREWINSFARMPEPQ
jgi:hypothetical protein